MSWSTWPYHRKTVL
jgi:hypothetical protein